jgi:hypothetical protein
MGFKHVIEKGLPIRLQLTRIQLPPLFEDDILLGLEYKLFGFEVCHRLSKLDLAIPFRRVFFVQLARLMNLSLGLFLHFVRLEI